jgi:hypothetical protein
MVTIIPVAQISSPHPLWHRHKIRGGPGKNLGKLSRFREGFRAPLVIQ